MIRKLMTFVHSETVKLTAKKRKISINADAFWKVVVGSLVEFHGLKHDDARKLIIGLKSRFKSVPPEKREGVSTFIYHEEPFYVACDLAQCELDISKYSEAYDKILDRYGW